MVGNRVVAALTLALVALALGACGGDDGGGEFTDAQAAKLQTYLLENTQADEGEMVSAVQVADGKPKVLTFLNGDLDPDSRRAEEMCETVEKSGVENIDGATIVDAGDVELASC